MFLLISILCACFSFGIYAQEATLKAQTIEATNARGKNGMIHAKGNVELKNSEIQINSQEVIINKFTKEATFPVQSKILYKDPQGYSSTIFSDQLHGNPNAKIFDGLNVKLLSEMMTFQAKTVKTAMPVINLTNARFSTCALFKIDEQNPLQVNECSVPWKGYASKISYNTNTKIFKANNVVINLHSIPIFYTPYISINLNQKKDGFQQFNLINAGGQQGFTFAYVKSSTQYGDIVVRPEIYFSQATDNSSLRAHNIKFTHQLEKNHFSTKTDIKTTLLQTNIPNNSGTDVKDKNFRYYIMSENKYYTDSSSTNINVRLSSDRFVRQVYDIIRENYFTSNISHTNFSGNKFYNIDSTYYKALTTNNQNTIPALVSSARYNQILSKSDASVQIISKNEVLNFQRMIGTSGIRANTGLELQKTFKFQSFEVETKPSLNLFHYTYRDTETQALDFAYRGIGDINTTLSKSFSYNFMGYITQVKPMLFFDYTTDSTHGNVINEDSATAFVTDNNIFTMSQYNGFDIVDAGLKSAYGLNVLMRNSENNKFNFFAGQRYNTQNGFSNYVGRASAKINKINASSRFIAKNDGSQILLSNSNISFEPFSFLNVGLGYFYLDKSLQNQDATLLTSVQNVENIIYSGSLKYKNHSLFGNVVQNPQFIGATKAKANIITQIGGGIAYSSECLKYKLGMQNQLFFDGTKNLSITSFIFEINFTK